MSAHRHSTAAAERTNCFSIRHRSRVVRHAWAACLAAWTILSSPVAAQTPSDPYNIFIGEAAQRFDLPPSWIRAVMLAESGFDPIAVSDKGAQGLMQIMPGTWDTLRAQYDLGDDPFAPRDNILAGAAYLRAMLDRYGSAELMLAAYHAGPGRTDEHVMEGRPLPSSTRAYIATVLPNLTGVGNVDSPPPNTPSPSDPTGDQLFVAVAAGSASSGPPGNGRNQDAQPSIDAPSVDPTGGLFAARDPAPDVSRNGALVGTIAASDGNNGDAPNDGARAEPAQDVASSAVGVVAPR